MTDSFSHDVLSKNCPARHVLEVLADKWALLLMYALSSQGPARTGELRRRVCGISEKMLIQTLRRMERFGLVERQSYPEVPPRVEYRLTGLGVSLSGPIRTLNLWVEDNVLAIQDAQQQYEQRLAQDAAEQ
ncbi:winged helix-turn-helix transcriptional regulator [Gallaecimonas xiamenensis]|uniref:Transcription regulator protein n=1 Tax=Gallaecimonas xiamenensis 3-C-1 TaxID=745411 RepID=K2J2Z2_9GAMM|nr:helix-turn-helix domain-containing protein [Gallaecimonas xiamenensis]EKE69478.1 transcription regulator protein [Gallaecimonas xiamenensis 3-C-1]